jgi:peptidoglycan-associated lipoprotein
MLFVNQKTLAVLGFAVLLTTAACSKKAPVAANHPPDATPVAPAEAPPSRPPAQRPTPAPQAQAAAPITKPYSQMTPQERETLNAELAKLADALFDYDKATVREDAATVLKDDVAVIRAIMSNYPNQKLLIEGHCDERGSEEYNIALGDRRAKSAEGFLASMGIPNAQLTIISFGKDRPVCTDEDEACWQRNRRAHITAAP